MDNGGPLCVSLSLTQKSQLLSAAIHHLPACHMPLSALLIHLRPVCLFALKGTFIYDGRGCRQARAHIDRQRWVAASGAANTHQSLPFSILRLCEVNFCIYSSQEKGEALYFCLFFCLFDCLHSHFLHLFMCQPAVNLGLTSTGMFP